MTTPTTSEWFYFPSTKMEKAQFFQEGEQGAPEWDYCTFWLGRSCGARLIKNPAAVPQKKTGIVVFPGKYYEGKEYKNRQVDHIETKNGPLTIVSDLTHIREK